MAQQHTDTPLLVTKAAGGWEVWAKWDAGAEVYELFASEVCDDYIGAADSIAKAQSQAKAWIEEMKAI